jgi:hypothetical protein
MVFSPGISCENARKTGNQLDRVGGKPSREGKTKAT